MRKEFQEEASVYAKMWRLRNEGSYGDNNKRSRVHGILKKEKSTSRRVVGTGKS